MSRHVEPMRWADAEAGALSSRELARIEAHARDCERCAQARERVRGARAAMRELAADEPDDMRWDQIGAQIYWRTSSARRAVERPERRWLPAALIAGAAVAVGAGVLGYVALRDASPRVAAPAPAEPPAPEQVAVAPVEAPAEPVVGVVTVVQGDVTLDGAAVEFDQLVVAGRTLATGDGRVVVQFDRDSTFALAPHTTLDLTRFDARQVQLDVRGTIDVRLSRRQPEQRFAIGAGERQVVVRGTVFRVTHGDDALEVACTRGRVSVVEGDESTDVRAGEHITVVDVLARSHAAQPIAESELAELTAALEVPILPAWENARVALDTTARLSVEARPAVSVDIDGIRVGYGALVVRLTPGRHHVERAGAKGIWITVDAGTQTSAEMVSAAGVRRDSVRTPQLEAELRKQERQLRRCARTLAVYGIAGGSFVTLEIGINRDGSQGFLNIVDSNVPEATASCVRNVIDGITLPPGPRETLRKTIPFDDQ